MIDLDAKIEADRDEKILKMIYEMVELREANKAFRATLKLIDSYSCDLFLGADCAACKAHEALLKYPAEEEGK